MESGLDLWENEARKEVRKFRVETRAAFHVVFLGSFHGEGDVEAVA